MFYIILCYGGVMSKPFSIEFKVDAKILAIIYVCWKYKFPLSYFLSFYEMYGAQTLFILKALACTKRITLNDNAFANLIEESRKLHKQIISGISTKLKIKQLEAQVKAGKLIDEDIPENPELDLNDFSEDYREYIELYLLKNIEDIFSEKFKLRLNTKDLYQQIAR